MQTSNCDAGKETKQDRYSFKLYCEELEGGTEVKELGDPDLESVREKMGPYGGQARDGCSRHSPTPAKT